MKKILLFAFVLMVLIDLNTLSFSQILIEEGKVKLDVNPAESIAKTLRIYNTSTESIPVKVYWQDFQYIAPFDGSKNFSSQGSYGHSIKNWITFSPAEFVLPPQSKKEINYSIKIPQDADGGYYGVLFFEKGVVDKQSITGVNIITRVGCLFFLETKNKSKKSEISQLSVSKGTLQGTFTNAGNVILIPHGIFYIMDKEGIVIDRGEVQKYYLPPGKSVTFKVNLPAQLKEGSYIMVLTFDLDEGDSIVKEIDFTSDSAAEIKILQQRD